jgi:hypothetical protein
MARHRELALASADHGIETHYCGPREQLEWIDALPEVQRKGLKRILGEAPHAAFYHKGASVMRNITYLKLRELWRQANEPLLFHFIDSDQEFRIKIATAMGDRDVYALSYFHALDRLFSGTDAVVATGKVVGDPPVSSSVMMSGFLDDVLAFLQRAANTRPKDSCGFHASQGTHEDGGAIYHDMPELFGFSPAQTSFDYSCDLAGPHTNSDCLDHFAAGLNRFFYGEHPTRKTRYGYAGTALGIAPARTVYSGNYMMRPEGLRYFLPFAPLRLRMPGPTLGRIVKAELAGRFVAVNLPMLHQRTVGDNGETEFRPGVESLQDTVDISGEFIRQFFGDVMLFSIEKLTAMGFPQVQPDEASLIGVLDETRASLLKSYNARQETIGQKVARIEACVDDPRAWWRTEEGAGAALYRLRVFLAGVTHNFGPGSAGYAEINDAARWGERRAQMAQAIAAYIEDRTAWESVVFGE